MSDDIARAVAALEEYDVAYETTATDTVVEADSLDELFAAVRAAHEAIGGERVISSLEIDDQRGRDQRARDRVEAVERALGHPPRRDLGERDERGERRSNPEQGSRRSGYQESESEGGENPERHVSRYGGSTRRDPRRREETTERYGAGERGRGFETRERGSDAGSALRPRERDHVAHSRWERRTADQQPLWVDGEPHERRSSDARERGERRWSRRDTW